MVKYTDRTDSNAPVITLEQAKANLNLEADFTEDDALIEGYIEAAQSECVAYICRPLGYALVLDCNNFDGFEVEALDVAALGTVQYLPEGETEYADLPAENVKFQKRYGGNVYQVSFKATDAHPLPVLAVSDAAVRLTVNVTCPASVRQGMLLRITDFYEKREDRGEIGNNSASRSLWRPFRQY